MLSEWGLRFGGSWAAVPALLHIAAGWGRCGQSPLWRTPATRQAGSHPRSSISLSPREHRGTRVEIAHIAPILLRAKKWGPLTHSPHGSATYPSRRESLLDLHFAGLPADRWRPRAGELSAAGKCCCKRRPPKTFSPPVVRQRFGRALGRAGRPLDHLRVGHFVRGAAGICRWRRVTWTPDRTRD